MKIKYNRFVGDDPQEEDSLGSALTSSSSSSSSEDDDEVVADNNSKRTSWCKLAYWEECRRIGRLYPVSASTIEIFSVLPKGDGLCLASLFEQNDSPSESTARTRKKIGQGILLNQDETGVWVYNRTDNPVFVNSPTLEPPPLAGTETTGKTMSNNPFTVFKVPPGYSVQVFDYDKSRIYERLRDPKSLDGPFDPHSIRISFAKGWGTNYSRQVVTNCPCWLEVLLNVPLHTR
jgi:MAD (mothers against decapentaplegic) family protein 6/7